MQSLAKIPVAQLAIIVGVITAIAWIVIGGTVALVISIVAGGLIALRATNEQRDRESD